MAAHTAYCKILKKLSIESDKEIVCPQLKTINEYI
jgi:phage FluMu protein Com